MQILANDMDAEVRLQNEMIRDVGERMDHVDSRFTKQNKDLEKLAKY